VITYVGKRIDGEAQAWIETEFRRRKKLKPRLDLRKHSPTGFEWGYGGSGPAQLALAICMHHLQDRERALEVYQAFKFAVVAKLDAQEWTLTEAQVHGAIENILAIMKAGAQDPGHVERDT
jgi:hypothetical protein